MAQPVQRSFDKRHNQAVNLASDFSAADYFRPVLNFLQESRINFILQEDMPINIQYVQQFWNNLHSVQLVNPQTGERRSALSATINNQEFTFTARRLRTIFHLGAVEQERGITVLEQQFLHGTLRRMGYSGHLPVSQYAKSRVFGQWRYLFHVFVSVFKNTKTGHDNLDGQLVSMLVSLVYNRPYPFARYVFDQFINELNHPKPLLLFPRFVMIIIRHFLTDLPNQGLVARVGVVDNKIFQTCLKHHPRRADEDVPQETPLFGAILNPNYEAPAHNAAEDVAAPVLAGYVSKKVPQVRKYLLENSPDATFIMDLPQVPPIRKRDKIRIQTVDNNTMAKKMNKLDVPTAPEPSSSNVAHEILREEVHIDSTTKKMENLETVVKVPETILEENRILEVKLQMQDEVMAKQKEMFEAKIQMQEEVNEKQQAMFELKMRMQDEVIAKQKTMFVAQIQMQDKVIAEQKAAFEARIEMQDEVISKQKAMFEAKTQMVEAAEKLMSLIIKSKIAELKVKLERGNPDDEVIRSTGIFDIKSVMDLIPESLRVKLEARFSSMYEGFKSLFLTHVDDNQWAKIESELEKEYKGFLE